MNHPPFLLSLKQILYRLSILLGLYLSQDPQFQLSPPAQYFRLNSLALCLQALVFVLQHMFHHSLPISPKSVAQLFPGQIFLLHYFVHYYRFMIHAILYLTPLHRLSL